MGSLVGLLVGNSDPNEGEYVDDIIIGECVVFLDGRLVGLIDW